MISKRFKTVDEYINSFSRDVKDRLKKIRNIVKKEAPDSNEIVSYNMPAYKYQGRILLYFAAHKEHIGFYPLPAATAAFKRELSKYHTSKGSIRFPNDRPVPYDLIAKIVRFRVKEELKGKK